ncbi:hypothetical protein GRI97_17030 [Altererythrobacter xixiisoli]|uniref:Uncharacterized protein n=1 Tax=Croceibacterium xixiisoli TaxID=1476466 RepID=A0A6I4U183_9SPHN|nr:hypothetical protein [Croceibacterium xixiisoli]MXP00698.1 hypothetical protein [Croceibacterium xixiisoli]
MRRIFTSSQPDSGPDFGPERDAQLRHQAARSVLLVPQRFLGVPTPALPVEALMMRRPSNELH